MGETYQYGALAGYEKPKRLSAQEQAEMRRAAAKAKALSRKWIHPDKRSKFKSVKAWQGGGCSPK